LTLLLLLLVVLVGQQRCNGSAPATVSPTQGIYPLPPAVPSAAAADINHHPLQMVELLRPLLPLLHPGGAVILTLKFYGRAAGRDEEWLRRLTADLGPGFERVQLLWLLANTQHEQTCVAYKAAAPQTDGKLI
jgi:hypothetical protein